MSNYIDTCLKGVLRDRIALAVMQLLYLSPGGMTGRGIARDIGYSPQATLNALKILERPHLIVSRPAGTAKLYELNDDHWLLSESLIPMWEKLASWSQLLGQFYMNRMTLKPLAIIMYGSYAKGEATEGSDVDLFFVFDGSFSDDNVSEILELGSQTYSKFAVHVSVKFILRDDFKKGIKTKEGFLRNVYREGRSIAGLNLTEVVGYDS